MKNIKKAIPSIAISILFLVVFNVISFILAEKLDSHFWCGYVFITLSFLCLIVIESLTYTNDDTGKSVFLNLPSITVTLIHLVIQLIIGVAVMCFKGISIRASVCFEILIFAIYLTFVVLLEVYKSKN